MLIATESFDLDGNEIRAGITRCSPDAEAIQRYPEKFRDDPDGPPGAAAIRTEMRADDRHRRPAGDRLPLAEELRIRRERIAEIERDSREEFLTPDSRERAEFWRGVDRLLARAEGRPEETDAVYDIEDLDRRAVDARVSEIDAAWGNERAPWHRPR